MEINYDLLWDKSNPIHVATYRKRIFDPTKNGDNSKELAKATGELFDFNQGYRLAGALSVYAQIDSNRKVADVDVFVGYTDEQGWENTYDHRLSPIIPTTFPTEAVLEYEKGNVRAVFLEYMAAVKVILIEDEAIFGVGNKLDREKNEFDLENILRNLKADFSDKLKEILKEICKRRTERHKENSGNREPLSKMERPKGATFWITYRRI